MTDTQTRALVLFAHGARDPLWAQPLEHLRLALARIAPQMAVRVAFLEMQEPGLVPTLAELAAQGRRHIDVAPIFWSKGGHIADDLPPRLAAFARSHPGVAVRVLPVLSDLPGMHEFIARTLLQLADAPQ